MAKDDSGGSYGEGFLFGRGIVDGIEARLQETTGGALDYSIGILARRAGSCYVNGARESMRSALSGEVNSLDTSDPGNTPVGIVVKTILRAAFAELRRMEEAGELDQSHAPGGKD